MKVTAIRTPLVKLNDDLLEIIKKSLSSISEKSVLVVASKIISFCQGRIIKKTLPGKEEKYALARQEADFYLEPVFSKYHIILTIKNHTLAIK